MGAMQTFRRTLGTTVVLFVVVLVAAAPASAGFHAGGVNGDATASSVGAQVTTIDECTEIAAPGTYTLTSDIDNSTADTCFEITSDNVVLDGNGHTISGGEEFTTGVYAHGINASARTNDVTVRDLTVSDWGTGIKFKYFEGGTISNVKVVSNSLLGVNLDDYTTEVTVRNARISDNDQNERGDPIDAGIDTSGVSERITVTDSNVSDNNGVGITIRGNFSTVNDTTVSRNDGIPIRLQNSHNGTVRNITVRNNGLDDTRGLNENGIYVQGATNNVVADSTFVGNAGTGISLRVGFQSYTPARDNVIVNNTVRDNRQGGIRFTGAINATVRDNTISNSSVNFGVEGTFTSHFRHNVSTTNTVNGDPIYYLRNETGAVVDATDAAFVGAVDSRDITVRGLTLDQNTRHGGLFVNTTDATVDDVTVTENRRGGLFFQNTSEVVVSDTTVRNNSVDGIVLRGANDTRLRNTTVVENGPVGGFFENGIVWERSHSIPQALDTEIDVDFPTVHNNTVRDGRVTGNVDAGIRVDHAAGTALIGNNVSDNGIGISLGGANHSRVIANTVLDSEDEGIELFNNPTVNNTIADNNVSGHSFEPSVRLSGLNSTVTNNTVVGAPISVEGSGHAIRNNTASEGGSYGAISVGGREISVTGNEITDSDTGVMLTNSENVTVDGNVLSDNDVGIDFGSRTTAPSATQSTVTDNVISGGNEGILVSGSDNTVENVTVTDTGWAYVESDASDNRVRRLAVGPDSDPTTVDFTSDPGSGSGFPELRIGGVENPPSDPGGRHNVGAYVDTSARSDSAWIDLTVHYEGDVENESTLELWRNDGTDWSALNGSTLNTSSNEVSANVTEFGVLAPLAVGDADGDGGGDDNDTSGGGDGSPLGGISGTYDADADGSISIGELGDAAADYATGEITITQLGSVAATYAAG